MQPSVAPRQRKCVPPERDFLSKDNTDVSQRTVCSVRGLHPERTRCVPLAAPRHVDMIRTRVGHTPRRAGALTSPL